MLIRMHSQKESTKFIKKAVPISPNHRIKSTWVNFQIAGMQSERQKNIIQMLMDASTAVMNAIQGDLVKLINSYNHNNILGAHCGVISKLFFTSES